MKLLLLPAYVLVVVLWASGSQAEGLQCIGDAASRPLRDWWVMFKHIGAWSNPLVPGSYEVPNRNYSYSDDGHPTIQRSDEYIGNYYGALTYTLSQLWDSGNDYLIYNDEPLPPFGPKNITCYPWDPNGEACAKVYGHAKGVISWDQSGHGFWLIHSFPLFPCGPGAAGSLVPGSPDYIQFSKYCNMTDSVYQAPARSQLMHAQNAMCVSFSGWAEFEKIACQVGIYNPVVYDSQLSPLSRKKLPTMDSVSRMDFSSIASQCKSNGRNTSVLASEAVGAPISEQVSDLTSAKGQKLVGFATGASFNADLYGALIGATVKADVTAQTWWTAGDTLLNQCTPPYRVYNVSHVDFSLYEKDTTTPYPNYASWDNHNNFPCTDCGPCYYTPGTVCGTQDHSKWALVPGMYCAADKNRAPTQLTRGGGALCLDFGSNNHALLEDLNKLTKPYSCN